jgi:hypothetical protein
MRLRSCLSHQGFAVAIHLCHTRQIGSLRRVNCCVQDESDRHPAALRSDIGLCDSSSAVLSIVGTIFTTSLNIQKLCISPSPCTSTLEYTVTIRLNSTNDIVLIMEMQRVASRLLNVI